MLTPNENNLNPRRYAWIFFLVFPFMARAFIAENNEKVAYILPVTAQLNFNDKAIKLEVARTKTALARGLTYSGLQVGEVQLLFKAFSEIRLNI